MSTIAFTTRQQGQDEPKKARYQFTTQYVVDLRNVTGYYVGYVSPQVGDRGIDYDLIKNDEAVKHALHLMSIFAAGEGVIASGERDEINDLINFCLRQIKDFTHARKSLIEQGILFGLGVQRKYRDMRAHVSGLDFDCVVKLKEIDRRRMRLERDVTDRTCEYWTIWNPATDAFHVIEDRATNPCAALAMQDFAWYVHEFEELSPNYRGLGEVLWRAVYLRSRLIQYAGDLSESWGKPVVMAAIESAMLAINSAGNLASGFYNAQKVVDEYLVNLNKMRARSIFVYPSQDKIELREAGNTGSNIIQNFLDYLDGKIELLILGSKLVSGTSDQGSFALGQIHRGSTQSLVMYNRARLQEVIENEILCEFFARNRVQLHSLGIQYPRRDEIKCRIVVAAEEAKNKALLQGKEGDRLVRSLDKIN